MNFKKSLVLLTTASTLALSTIEGHSCDFSEQAHNIPQPFAGLSNKQQELINAVTGGDLSTVKRLINREKVDRDTQDIDDGNSILHLAIQKKKEDIVEFLLKVNCDVNIKNLYGETPLHEAAINGDKTLLELLLQEETALVNIQDDDGNTAFHKAVQKQKMDCVLPFMKTEKFDYTLENKQGKTVVALLEQQNQWAQEQAATIQQIKESLSRSNVLVHSLLKKDTDVTPALQELGAHIMQQNKRIFLSYCWNRSYSTKPMVDDFENFLKKLNINNYYRDVREEEGLGMTMGTDIEAFMRHAKEADLVLIFLNDAYLRSRNCMYEFLQVWDESKAKLEPKAFVVRHPEFNEIFGGPNAAIPYTNHWNKVFEDLRSHAAGLSAANMDKHNMEEGFVIKIAKNMPLIIDQLQRSIQADYKALRSNGFRQAFELALAGRPPRQNQRGLSQAQFELPSNISEGNSAKVSSLGKTGKKERYVRPAGKVKTSAQNSGNDRIASLPHYSVATQQEAEKQHNLANYNYHRAFEDKHNEADSRDKPTLVKRSLNGLQPDKISAGQKEAFNLYKMGREKENARNFIEALDHYTQAAHKGNGKAANIVGFFYLNGKEGIPANAQAAKEWFTVAKELGYKPRTSPSSKGISSVEQADEKQAVVSEKHNMKGFQLNKLAREAQKAGNLEEALRLYKEAAEEGNAKAANSVGFFYSKGMGLPSPDEQQARHWSEVAKGLGYQYKDPQPSKEITRKKQSNPSGETLKQEKADKQAAGSGEQNIKGFELNKLAREAQKAGNLEEALQLYKKAAEEGNAKAANSVRFFYLEGMGLPSPDEQQATHWFEVARSLGYQYEDPQSGKEPTGKKQGNSSGKTLKQEKAGKQGAGSAKQHIKGFQLNKLAKKAQDAGNFEEALQLYKEAAEEGNAKAANSVSFFYSRGIGGLVKDEEQAKRWSKIASDLGYQYIPNKKAPKLK